MISGRAFNGAVGASACRAVLLMVAACSLVASLPASTHERFVATAHCGQRCPADRSAGDVWDAGVRCRGAPGRDGQYPLRLRGGVPVSDEQSTEDSAARPAASQHEPEAAAAEDSAEDAAEDSPVVVGGGDASDVVMEKANAEGGEGEDGAEAEMERPPPTPEVVRQMNERMWEAAQEGNEPLLAKVLAAGADVNAFCRGPDRWLNISVGEIAGASDLELVHTQ